MSLLDVTDLSVTIGGVRLLREVSFAMAPGETVGLVGESGSGKSLLALTLIGLLPPAAVVTGRMTFAGAALDEARQAALRGAQIGMVFQEPMTALDPRQRIEDAVGEALRVHRGLSRGEARQAAAALLQSVGLAPPQVLPGTYPHRLSGGQRQRVLIAAALACRPQLLLADEPTTALDSTTQARILDLLRDLAAAQAMAMLLVSHDLALVAQRATRIMVMYAGSLVEEGATEAVFSHLAHPYTRALFAASPATAPGRRPVPIAGALPDPRALPSGCVFAPRCPRASPRCQTVPPLAGDATHRIACWHPA